MCPRDGPMEQKALLLGYGSMDASGTSSNDSRDDIGTKSEETAPHHGKTIGYLGCIAIGVNSLCGPAILQLPYQFQQSGLIPTTLCLLFVGILSSFVTLHMSNVVSKVPGNANFDKNVEFSDPFKTFWSRKAFIGTQIIFYLCTISLNIAAIVDAAQVMDSALGHTTGSFALNFDIHKPIVEWHHGPCSRKQVKKGLCDPFGATGLEGDQGEEYPVYIVTFGYLIAVLVFLPICLRDLQENTAWQIFGFLVTVTVSIEFIIAFCMHEPKLHHVTWWGHDYSGMLGVILFNYGLVLAMPAMLSEKKAEVKTTHVVYSSVLMTTLLYVFVGALGGMSMSHVNINMLKPMVSGAYGGTLQGAGWFFAFFIIGLDIPLFSVLTRYNLTSSGLCSRRTANIFVVYLPWTLSWIFYQGKAVGELLSWGGVLFTSAIAFLLPLYLALRTFIVSDAEGSIEVYGGLFQSRRAQVAALYVLLFLAFSAVCLGIIGQAESDIVAQDLQANEAYLNGTNTDDERKPLGSDAFPILPGSYSNVPHAYIPVAYRQREP